MDAKSILDLQPNDRPAWRMSGGLTVGQVTAVISLAATLATGAVLYFTRVPKVEASAAARSAPAGESKADALAAQLQAHTDEIDGIRADVRDTRDQVRELRGDVRELRATLRSIERAVTGRRAEARVGEGGGSK